MIKEFHVSKNLFDEQYANLDTTIRYKPIYVGDGTFTLSSTAPLASGSAAMIFFLTGERSGGADTSTNGVSSGISRTVTATNGYVTVAYRIAYNISPVDYNTMLNEGSSPLPYEPYGNKWNTKSYAKSITGAQTYTKFPIVLRTTEQSIPIWSMDGNTETSGTASPQNPIAIEGVGEKTENLYNPFTVVKGRLDSGEVTGSTVVTIDNTTINAITFTVTSQYRGVVTDFITIPNDVTRLMFSFSKSGVNVGAKAAFYQTDKTWISDVDGSTISTTIGFTPPTNSAYMRLVITAQAIGTAIISNMMLSYGWEVKEFVPFGYKIPLSSNGAALSPIYLSEQLMEIDDTSDSLISTGTVTYNIKKFVLTGGEDWRKYTGSDNKSFFYTALSGSIAAKLLCTHYERVYISTNSTNIGADVSTDGYLRIRPENSDSYQTTAFTAWLAAQHAAGTPVTVYYILATPTTETVTVPTIPTTSGLNTIDVDTTVKPSEMSLTYDGYKICKPKRKSENLFDKDNAERFHYGKGENNTVGYAYNAAMFCFKISHNTNYACKVYDEHNTMLRIYRSHYPLTKPESGNTIEYVELIEREASLNPQVTINSGDCDYLWLQFTDSWYDSYSGNGVMLNEGSTALPYEPYWK